MKIVTAFYAGMVLDEYDPGPDIEYIRSNWPDGWPDGTYFYNRDQRRWYHHQNGSSGAIEIAEVPAQLRTILLLLA